VPVGGLAIHVAFGQGSQLLVGSFFFVEILLENARTIAASELLGPYRVIS
jgi:hypothetical protein